MPSTIQKSKNYDDNEGKNVMSKISNELREEAAIYCSIMANFWTFDGTAERPVYAGNDYTVASRAHLFVALSSSLPNPWIQWSEYELANVIVWAEAEALLRTGWEP